MAWPSRMAEGRTALGLGALGRADTVEKHLPFLLCSPHRRGWLRPSQDMAGEVSSSPTRPRLGPPGHAGASGILLLYQAAL